MLAQRVRPEAEQRQPDVPAREPMAHPAAGQWARRESVSAERELARAWAQRPDGRAVSALAPALEGPRQVAEKPSVAPLVQQPEASEEPEPALEQVLFRPQPERLGPQPQGEPALAERPPGAAGRPAQAEQPELEPAVAELPPRASCGLPGPRLPSLPCPLPLSAQPQPPLPPSRENAGAPSPRPLLRSNSNAFFSR